MPTNLINYLLKERKDNVENPHKETFTKYLMRENKDRIIFRGILQFKGLEQIGIYFSYLIGPLIIYYLPVSGGLFTIIKLLFMLLAFVITRRIVTTLLSIKILEINKIEKELKFPLDNFETNLSAIRELSIIEDVYQKDNNEFMRYRLKFILPDGEKSSVFAFTAYGKAQEIIELIKKS